MRFDAIGRELTRNETTRNENETKRTDVTRATRSGASELSGDDARDSARASEGDARRADDEDEDEREARGDDARARARERRVSSRIVGGDDGRRSRARD